MQRVLKLVLLSQIRFALKHLLIRPFIYDRYQHVFAEVFPCVCFSLPLGVNDERLDRGIRSVTFQRCYLKFAQKNLFEFCAAFFAANSHMNVALALS